ncbi:MAG: hypothetical protein ACR2OV_04035 [Hyphomicrobiaceae bacterium]
MPSTKTTLALVAGAVCAVGLAWVWWGFQTGYVIAPWDRREVVFCDGRVAREFSKFWKSIGLREFLPREGYSISARHVAGDRTISVSLRQCKTGTGKLLECQVDQAEKGAGLRKGQQYTLDPAAVTNWTYYRNFKFYHGCNLIELLSTNFARNHCERVARNTFVDFSYAVETKKIDPEKQWVDVQLAPYEPGRIWQRLEARLNQCRRKESGEFVCRVDSASPESGVAIGNWLVVEADDVLSWMYTIDQRQIRSCDGEDLRQLRLPRNYPGERPLGNDAKQ